MQLSALTSALGRVFSELLRRKVLRVASLYVVTGWIVLQVALALQSAMSLPGGFSTIVLSLLIIGLPVALVISWFFEFTPHGIKRTAAAGEGSAVHPQTTDWMLIGLLTVVAGVSVFQAATFGTRDTPVAATPEQAKPKAEVETPLLGDKSIAVLPFANLSPDKENEYFADGLTEELLNLLAKVGDLKVVSRTSSFAFKGKNAPLPEIAKQLGVRHVLEGSVRAEGDELRVTAQLIDVSTDTHLWSETYERKIEYVFALQDEIARDIAGALKVEVTLAAGGRAPTTNLEAYRLFLKARALHVRRGEGDLQQGVDLYKRAIALDPKFAAAHAALATNYAAMAAAAGGPFPELRRLARQSADAALALDPNIARAYGALGALARQELKWEPAVNNYSKALALDPADSVTLVSLATTLSMIGEFAQAKPLRDEAGRLDPIYNFLLPGLRLGDALARRDDAAVMTLARKLQQAPGEVRVFAVAALILLARERGATEEAERGYRDLMKGIGTSGPLVESVARALKSRSAFGEAARVLQEEAAKNPAFEPDGFFAIVGDHDRFFNALDARVARDDTARFLRFMPFAWRFSSAGGDANRRFKTFARSIGLVDYWRKHGWPDRCRATAPDDFECS